MEQVWSRYREDLDKALKIKKKEEISINKPFIINMLHIINT